MEWSSAVGLLLLVLIIFLVIKMIVDSIKVILVVLLTLFVLVFFFGVSFSEVLNWLSSQEWLRSLGQLLAHALLFSLSK